MSVGDCLDGYWCRMAQSTVCGVPCAGRWFWTVQESYLIISLPANQFASSIHHDLLLDCEPSSVWDSKQVCLKFLSWLLSAIEWDLEWSAKINLSSFPKLHFVRELCTTIERKLVHQPFTLYKLSGLRYSVTMNNRQWTKLLNSPWPFSWHFQEWWPVLGAGWLSPKVLPQRYLP